MQGQQGSPVPLKSLEPKEKSSTTSYAHSTESYESLPSASSSSSSSRPPSEALVEDQDLYPPSPYNATRGFYPTQRYGKLDIDIEVDEVVQVNSISQCGAWTRSSRSVVLDMPHKCRCRTRSTCPHFLRKHFTQHVQNCNGRPLPVFLLNTYLASADAYARSRDALSLPAAKLQRAKAEYDWTLSRQNRTLWSPRLQDQLLAARRKVVAAEEEWESVDRTRWARAHFLVNLGRF